MAGLLNSWFDNICQEINNPVICNIIIFISALIIIVIVELVVEIMFGNFYKGIFYNFISNGAKK
jgi:hypothetical protein